MTSSYPKGSEWRKWDLHIHSPETNLANKYGSDKDAAWASFAEKVKANELAVIGLTNYFFLRDREIETAREKLEQCGVSCTVLPNIEVRIADPNKDGDFINVHFIFSENISSEAINDSLSRVELVNTGDDGRSFYCRENDIAQVRIKRVLVGFNAVLDQLDKDFKRGIDYIVAVCSRGHGHFRPERGDGRRRALAVEIDKKAHCIFGNCDDTTFYLRENRYEGSIQKPVFYCSDAHEIDKIGSRYTWIKADPTFNGLLQTLYEPESRVRIQDYCPDQKNDYEVIDKVRFVDNSGRHLFPSDWIELNPGLNSIIGGKSSGKSLLLYHIAKTIDSQKTQKAVNHGDASIRYAYKYDDLDFEVRWRDGKVVKLSETDNSSDHRPITFIPQLYLNAIAEKESEDFREAINDILKQYPGYEEWLSSKREEIESKRKEIHAAVNDYMALHRRLMAEQDSLRKIGDKQAIQANLNGLKKRIEELKNTTELSEEDLQRYSELEEKRNEAQKKLEALSIKERLFSELSDSISATPGRFKETQLDPLLVRLTMKYASLNEAKGIIESILNDLYEGIKQAINGSLAKLSQDAPNFAEERERLEAEINSISKDIAPLENKLKSRKLFVKLVEGLKAEEQKLKNILAKEHELAAIQDRLKSIKLSDKLDELIKLYNDIVSKNKEFSNIDEENETVLISNLSFDGARFYENFTSRLYKKMSLAKQISEDIFSEDNTFKFDVFSYKQAIGTIFKKLINGQLRINQGSSLDDAVHALLDDYFKIDYDLEQHGDKLLEMSPGKRGIILFQLFLHLSNASHPILIDQPEDNLDNRTVYKELNDFIKKKKNERQIIIVSHNANLVVSTDSEEVIVANQAGQNAGGENKKFQFEYVSGSLENSFSDSSKTGILYQKGIREHVCEILEGGLEAFKKREKQYQSVQSI